MKEGSQGEESKWECRVLKEGEEGIGREGNKERVKSVKKDVCEWEKIKWRGETIGGEGE